MLYRKSLMLRIPLNRAVESIFVPMKSKDGYYVLDYRGFVLKTKMSDTVDKKLFLEQTKDLLTLIGQDEKLRTVFNIEAAKYGDLFEQMGIKLSKETLDNKTKNKIKNMR